MMESENLDVNNPANVANDDMGANKASILSCKNIKHEISEIKEEDDESEESEEDKKIEENN